MKSYLPRRRIYLSLTTGQQFFRALHLLCIQHLVLLKYLAARMMEESSQFNADCIFGQLLFIVDWIVSDFLAIRQGSLGRLRYILKNGLKYLPLYGFYFAQVATCMLWQKSFSAVNSSHDYGCY